MSSIAISHLRKCFGSQVILHDINLEIEAGEFVVILGPSGCGKSTLLRLIAGLETPSAGTIRINQRDVTQVGPADRGCAMVFQNYALYPHMTVADNIGYSLKLARVPKAERQERVTHAARAVGMENYLQRRPSALSGGQRQRVAMARAIVRHPNVFLFDEPLSNLDASLRVQVRDEIRQLHQRLGITSIFVTHDQIEAMTLADKLVVMHDGYIEQVGKPLDIYRHPRTVFVASFLGTPPMNRLQVTADAAGQRLLIANTQQPVEGIHLPSDITVPDKLLMGIRPESCALVSVTSPGVLPAEVRVTEELGYGRIVHLDLFGQTLSVTESGHAPRSAGDRVGVQLNPKAVCFFDASSGKNLAMTMENQS